MKMMKRIMAGALVFILCLAASDVVFARDKSFGTGQQSQGFGQFFNQDGFAESFQRGRMRWRADENEVINRLCQLLDEEDNPIPRGRGFGQGMGRQGGRQCFNGGINNCEWCPWLELQ